MNKCEDCKEFYEVVPGFRWCGRCALKHKSELIRAGKTSGHTRIPKDVKNE